MMAECVPLCGIATRCWSGPRFARRSGCCNVCSGSEEALLYDYGGDEMLGIFADPWSLALALSASPPHCLTSFYRFWIQLTCCL